MQRQPRRLWQERTHRDSKYPRQSVRSLFFEPLEDRSTPSIAIQLDYTFDTNNFFDTQAKRDLMQLAANSVANRLGDDLAAIQPAGGNTWTASFTHPGTGSTQNINNLVVPADTLIVYVGGRNITSIGVGGFGGWSGSGSPAWLDLLASRGEAGALASPATDFGPWGGAITFDTVLDPGNTWFFSTGTAGMTNETIDFLSVAEHELTHMLGFGTAESWDRYVSGTSFTGPASVAAYDLGGNVPLDSDRSHWLDGTTDGGSETAMDPVLTNGTRKLLTDLDFAGLDDVGWSLVEVAPPEDRIGTFRSATWFLDVNGNRSWNTGTDVFFNFGLTTDTPVPGDWNNDGFDDAGVFRGGRWYLDSNGNRTFNQGDADFGFGLAGDTPVVGDWDGNGVDDWGVFRNGAWFLDLNRNGGWDGGDVTFNFGLPGDRAVTGDWNGDGSYEWGVYRNGTWFLDMNRSGGWDTGSDAFFNFGLSGDKPVTGDWNGDGLVEWGVFRNGTWFLDINRSGGWETGSDAFFNFGLGSDTPLTGKWAGASGGAPTSVVSASASPSQASERLALQTATSAAAELLFGQPPVSPSALDATVIPFFDGETPTEPSGTLINRFGGSAGNGPSGATIQRSTLQVRSGSGAYLINPDTIPVGNSDFIQIALTDFGANSNYVDTRDLSRFAEIVFYVRNETGVPFSLIFEIKDHRDSNSHRAQRTTVITSATTWQEVRLPLNLSSGWVVTGSPDLSRAKILSLIFSADRGAGINGNIFLDDMAVVEAGGPLDPATANITTLLQRLAQRQFYGLWGSRDRNSALVGNLSVDADVMALNSTAALVKLLPGAVERGWILQSEADAHVTQLVATVDTMMNLSILLGGGFVPARYVDRVDLTPALVFEESSADAALLFLALYQYKSLPTTPVNLANAIQSLLDRFNFAAFRNAQGWRLAYDYGLGNFTTGTYDGYSGEVWLISLAAHLASVNQVNIATAYHTGTLRAEVSVVDALHPYVVHSSADFRPPFVQWLFPLFVDTSGRGLDNFPTRSLATNPLTNAVDYQQDVAAYFAGLGRGAFLQPDAGDDGTGANYRQFSAFNNFGQPNLFMPWSVGYAFLADPTTAETSLRHHLQTDLQGPLGLADSATWATGQNAPSRLTARHDFWNLSLSTMGLVELLYDNTLFDNSFLTNLTEVRAALDQVFYPRTSVGVFRGGKWFLDTTTDRQWVTANDATFPFGLASHLPVVGDWNGDGYSDVGVFGTGRFFLDTNGNRAWQTGVDLTFQFGITGDVPVAGDWDADGRDDWGVFRNGRWYLDTNRNGQWETGTDTTFAFGLAGDTPVVGDWNGDGFDDWGVFRNGRWFLDTNRNGLWEAGTDRTFVFGAPGDRASVGDFNSDRNAEVAVLRGGIWSIDLNGNGNWDGTGTHNDLTFAFGLTGDLPVAGIWNNSGSSSFGGAEAAVFSSTNEAPATRSSAAALFPTDPTTTQLTVGATNHTSNAAALFATDPTLAPVSGSRTAPDTNDPTSATDAATSDRTTDRAPNSPSSTNDANEAGETRSLATARRYHPRPLTIDAVDAIFADDF